VSTYYFNADRSLSLDRPDGEAARDTYRVDYTAGSGEHSRWRNQAATDAAVRYMDRSRQDMKLLVYTSRPLDRTLEVTGHPVVTLFVVSSAADGYFFVYLEDVDEHGQVAYITEGQLRALHRKLSDDPPPYRCVLPYRTFMRKDALPLVPGEVAELVFDLLPTSYLFKVGHRIRIALAGADSSHFAIPRGEPPTLQICRSRAHASRLDLPTI